MASAPTLFPLLKSLPSMSQPGKSYFFKLQLKCHLSLHLTEVPKHQPFLTYLYLYHSQISGQDTSRNCKENTTGKCDSGHAVRGKSGRAAGEIRGEGLTEEKAGGSGGEELHTEEEPAGTPSWGANLKGLRDSKRAGWLRHHGQQLEPKGTGPGGRWVLSHGL